MKGRWIIAIIASDITASYSVEVFDRMVNWDSYVTAPGSWYLETAIAPIRVLPMLIKWAFIPDAPVVGYSIAYAIPFTITLFVTAYLLKRAVDPSLCRVCGYDLRATPDRCPECGTIAGKSGTGSV